MNTLAVKRESTAAEQIAVILKQIELGVLVSDLIPQVVQCVPVDMWSAPQLNMAQWRLVPFRKIHLRSL